MKHIPDEIPSNHHQIKQYRHEFVQKWTDDARNIYAQNHITHSSNTYSDQMTHLSLKKNYRPRRRQRQSHKHRIAPSTSSSSLLSNELYHKKESSNSTNQTNIKHKTLSTNNSAIVYLKSKKESNDNIECQIS